jgi:hypothetical protein
LKHYIGDMGGGALAVKMTTGVPVSSSNLGMERRGEEGYMMQIQRCRPDQESGKEPKGEHQ